MTDTSTPDQGALERAREPILVLSVCLSADDVARLHEYETKLRATAASEARAAALWEGVRVGWSVRHAETWELAKMFASRALAAPAQSAGSKIIEGLQEAVAHAKGEAPARYACGHWHQTFAEAQLCHRAPAQSEGK